MNENDLRQAIKKYFLSDPNLDIYNFLYFKNELIEDINEITGSVIDEIIEYFERMD